VEVKVGIVGCGVVGTGTVALLLENAKVIEEKTGIKLSVSKVADKDWSRPREYEVPSTLRTTDYREVIESSDIVVELGWGQRLCQKAPLGSP